MNQGRDYGILPPYEAFYIHSMLFSTTSALRSVELLNRRLERFYSGESEGHEVLLSQKVILDGLQNVVNQGAALSRYFWPSPRNKTNDLHHARAERLRRAFMIDDVNPLKNRDLRNAIEHFDEKLDLYLAKGIVGHIIPEYVGTGPEGAGVPLHVFRAYYVDVGVFEMLGRRYEVQPIVEEIGRIHDLLSQCASNGDRLPSL